MMNGYVEVTPEENKLVGNIGVANVAIFQGPPGVPGHTPVRGVDYYTDSDKAEIVASVLAALPVAEEASY